MPRELGPERAHFGGENGLVTETVGGVTKYYWRCEFCTFQMGGKCFPNMKARIHLSGDPSLRNGVVGQVCKEAPDKVKQKFANLVKAKRKTKEEIASKRKRQQEVLSATQPCLKQSKLKVNGTLKDDAVDDAWGRAFFTLDIPPNKIANPIFREAVAATKRSSLGCVSCKLCVLFVCLKLYHANCVYYLYV